MCKPSKKDQIIELLKKNQQTINTINEKYDQSFNELLVKAKKQYDQELLLKDIKIQVKKANIFFNETTCSYCVKIEYDVNPSIIYFDEDQVIKNKFLYSAAMLNILSAQDMKKVSSYIEEAKIKNKK